ncbi:hypothetical protein F4801DRAFT_458158 [Xylaria longipes]|nr:hypothetical protein F4801DRAFT_458158 [Xylaria longipes]
MFSIAWFFDFAPHDSRHDTEQNGRGEGYTETKEEPARKNWQMTPRKKLGLAQIVLPHGIPVVSVYHLISLSSYFRFLLFAYVLVFKEGREMDIVMICLLIACWLPVRVRVLYLGIGEVVVMSMRCICAIISQSFIEM